MSIPQAIEIWQLLLPAFIGGGCLALTSGPLGTLLVWQNLSYMADALAHASLLGFVLAAYFDLPFIGTSLCIGCLGGLFLFTLGSSARGKQDSLLLLFSHTALAFGLLLIAAEKTSGATLQTYLMGDPLTIQWDEALLMTLLAGLTIVFLLLYHKPLIRLTLHHDLARVSHIPLAKLQLIFMLLVTLLVSLAIHLVGAFLLTVLMVFPALITHFWSKRALSFLWISALISLGGFVFSFWLSCFFNLPLGPLAGICYFALFVFSYGTQKLKHVILERGKGHKNP
jgi:zinc transport system permease protein